MVKNPSTRPSQNYYRGPLSESVHEMHGLSPKSWSVDNGPLSTWTGGRMDGPQKVVQRGLLCNTA